MLACLSSGISVAISVSVVVVACVAGSNPRMLLLQESHEQSP